MKITRVGIDLGKTVFHVHAVDRCGKVVVERRLTRRALSRFMGELEPCLVGLEACGGAHYWARVLRGMGHDARLMSPQFVRPYVKSNKNDFRDADTRRSAKRCLAEHALCAGEVGRAAGLAALAPGALSSGSATHGVGQSGAGLSSGVRGRGGQGAGAPSPALAGDSRRRGQRTQAARCGRCSASWAKRFATWMSGSHDSTRAWMSSAVPRRPVSAWSASRASVNESRRLA